MRLVGFESDAVQTPRVVATAKSGEDGPRGDGVFPQRRRHATGSANAGVLPRGGLGNAGGAPGSKPKQAAAPDPAYGVCVSRADPRRMHQAIDECRQNAAWNRRQGRPRLDRVHPNDSCEGVGLVVERDEASGTQFHGGCNMQEVVGPKALRGRVPHGKGHELPLQCD